MIGRNDPCPCGSRRKYRKCCAETLSVFGLQTLLEERSDDLELEVEGVVYVYRGSQGRMLRELGESAIEAVSESIREQLQLRKRVLSHDPRTLPNMGENAKGGIVLVMTARVPESQAIEALPGEIVVEVEAVEPGCRAVLTGRTAREYAKMPESARKAFLREFVIPRTREYLALKRGGGAKV